jgi:hypothetical protein
VLEAVAEQRRCDVKTEAELPQDPYEIRRAMAAEGWISEDRITYMGWGKNADGTERYGFSVWFQRWDWHGQRCDSITFHASTDDLTAIPETVAKASALARRAYANFVEYPPYQDANGNLTENTTLRGIWERLGMRGAA